MLRLTTVKRHLDIKSARTSVDQQLIDYESRAVSLLEQRTGLTLEAQEPLTIELDSNELGALYLPGVIVGTVDVTNPVVKVRGSIATDFADATLLVLDTDYRIRPDRDRRASGLHRITGQWPTGEGLVEVEANLGYEEGGTEDPPPDLTMAVVDLVNHLYRHRVEKRQIDEPDEDSISEWPASTRSFIDNTLPWNVSSFNVKVLALG